jgi:tetratricopeptide (TPR) repeat protein
MNALAFLYQDTGRMEEAEALYADALAARRRVLGDEHKDTLTSMNGLAALYEATGRMEEAEALYADALAARRRVLGDEHKDTLTSMNNLATLLYEATGRMEEAEALYAEALAARRRVLGDENPKTLTSMNNLANVYYATGRPLQAAPLYEESVRGRLARGEVQEAEPWAAFLVGLLEASGLPTAAVEALCAVHGCACR